MRNLLWGALLVPLAILVYASPGLAQPCPVVTSNITLPADCEGPLVVAASGVHINLGGHTVRCTGAGEDGSDPDRVGIDVTNQTDVHINRGRVEKCGTGILLSGGGSHQLNLLEVAQNRCCGLGGDGDGIRLLDSHDNHITNTNSSFNHAFGVKLEMSHRNMLTNLHVEQNDGPPHCGGVLFEESDYNKLTASFLLGNGDAGVAIEGGTGNTIESSTILLTNFGGTPEPGTVEPFLDTAIELDDAINTTIRANRLNQNRFGVRMFGSTGTLIQANQANDNQRNGLRVGSSSTGTLIKANEVNNNAEAGIRLRTGATDSSVQANRAFGNGTFDMEDDNPACDANVWKSNKFGTANQPCIH